MEILTRDMSARQNDLDMTNALSKKDLDMSLYYFLDQVSILEGFTVGIIRNYEWYADRDSAVPD